MDAQHIWAAKTDEEVQAAGQRLFDYEEEGQRIIRAELERRGLPASAPGPATELPAASMDANRIGGLLILPGIGLALSSVFGIVALAQLLSLSADASAAGYGGAFVLAMLLEASMVAFTIVTTVRFMGRKRNAPMLVMVLFAARVAIFGLLMLVARRDDMQLLAAFSDAGFGRSLVYAFIWIPYFSVSKRVKATFVH